MGNEIFLSLAVSLGLTLLIELLFARLCGVREFLVVLLCNCLTNPPVVLLSHLAAVYTPLPTLAVQLVLEIAAVLVEALCYRECAGHIKRPFLFSLGANAVSYLSGLVLGAIL